MKNKKIKQLITATILGCLVMFIWGGLSHMVIFKGTGFKPLPNEDHLIKTLNENIKEQGLYSFPGIDFKNQTKEQETAWENKFRTGATGLLIYKPIGSNPFSANKLITQFISNLLSVLIAVIVASVIYASYWKRVIIICLLGILACTSVSSIYWNWYEFPTSFFLAQILDMLVGFFLAALVICKIIPRNDLIVNNNK